MSLQVRRPSKLYLTQIKDAVFFVMLRLLQGDEQKALCASSFVLMSLRSRVWRGLPCQERWWSGYDIRATIWILSVRMGFGGGRGMCRTDAPAALPRPHFMMKLEKIFIFKVILFN